ncbi:NADH-quinone oxidoreductase subunit C [Neobacillus drentensis]|uniref:NADH-quinone oxidoreductase subunit C n=1 Tax=Neobacillus drentensis TaxID=220684 RepID=UPI000825569A|nr:NADH-quinone oxidoreductase subunit C [Neobacillus drentensis]
MSGEKDLEQLKKEAVAKAKAAAAAKRKAMELAGGSAPAEDTAAPTASAEPEASTPASDDGDDLAKKKAAAVAKAKAAAAAKKKAMELAGGAPPAETAEGDNAPAGDDAKAKAAAAAKAKAVAVAKAKAAAAAKAKAAGTSADSDSDAAPIGGDDEKAKAIAAAKAKAKAVAAAKAKAAAAAGGKADATAAPAAEAKPSVNQAFLDKYVKVISEHLGSDVLEDSYINKLSKDVPTLVAKRDTYYKIAQFLKYNELLGFDYLSELHGSDFETHMEVYVHLFSYKNRQSVALKVKIDRSEPTIESLQPLWAGAEWPECEAYDLLGIKFPGHPDLRRILLGEDWVGHPLRKDYEPYDVEV